MPHLARRPRPLLAAAVAVAMTAAALVFASTAGAASAESQIGSYASRIKAGAPKGPFYTVERYGRSVTYRVYRKAVVVHNGRAVKHVAGAMRKDWNKQGAIRGTLGAPVTAKKCGVTGGGCIQRFQHGSIFRSSSAKRKVAISRVSGERSELIAVARSQVGYKEPGYRKNRYGKWINGGRFSNYAWCSFLMSWVSSASGNGKAIPKSKTYPSFLKAVRKRGNTSKTPKVGDLAFMDFGGTGRATHVGLVTAVHDTYVTTIEGNTDRAGRSSRPRGVHQINRSRSAIVFYATPDL